MFPAVLPGSVHGRTLPVTMKRPLGDRITSHPRVAAAIAFGAVTAVATHFEWLPDARMSGAAPLLTLGAGLAHAAAGVVTGPRLLDSTRTRTQVQACLLGAGTSLLAVLILAPALALWIASGNTHPDGALAFVALTLYIALFSYLGAGWPLLLVSAGIGWGLHRATFREPGGPRAA